MKIIKKVLVKQIVTEKSRKKLLNQFNKQKMRLEQECQQLLFEKKKLQNKPGVSKQDVTRRFQNEITKRREKMDLIDFKIEQMEMLELGVEIVEDEVEALVEVTEGMNWEEIMSEQSIVIKDGIIVRVDK
ncbi:YlqD family protein [Oceanobacillus caeni]|uniref:YlqD family protein n=1 Tax=Oceanobacillus caeni TaxID=405946 RepID=UPI001C23C359|nr:YlqD family protein [Oceanobacillus caeni]MBU8790116.1 YlqD family protein [Oceanobacillus caeni]